MHFNTLDHLRQQMYRCFERSRDALFNLSDALLSESQARSLPELSHCFTKNLTQWLGNTDCALC